MMSIFAPSLHAHWYETVARGTCTHMRRMQQQTTRFLRKQTKQAQRTASHQLRIQRKQLKQQIVRPVGVTYPQVQRAVFQATGRQKPRLSVVRASKALIPLRERHRTMRYFKVKGTAFAIEEVYKGKKYVWGVTATHYEYQFPAIPKKRFSYEPLTFRAQGNRHANDVSIFSIPESLADTFIPLKLAESAPKEGERLFSLSFFDNQFQYTPARKVLETSPLRFTTSLKIEPGIDREGECGSPLLNYDGEVVGMVVGASYTKEIGFAVSVDNIRQIMQAYHERETSLSPVFANGNKLIDLDVTEAIGQVRVKNTDGSFLERSTYHLEKELDYSHLENFIDLSQAKEITLTIEQTPFVTTGEKIKPTVKDITYDVEAGKITEMTILSAP